MVGKEGLGVTAVLAYLTGVGLMVSFAMLARQLAASVPTFDPFSGHGLPVCSSVVSAGLPWAPLPYLRVPLRASWIHLVAPVGLGLLAFLLLQSTIWPVPLTRAVAVAAS